MELTPERFREIDRVFDAALDRPPGEREAWLAATCGDDRQLHERVRALLVAHDRSDGLLESAAASVAAEWLDGPSSTQAPARAGAFRIIREIGAGGMGVVYLAEREGGGFEQRVALKLVRQGASSSSVKQRFLEERRILARLDHPGIARLVDGGLTSDGQPYFAMELVEGEPIDAWCRTHAPTIEQRIDLLIKAAEVVQYAHERLVIHRDLKPSNILVRKDGALKLLDFGIAKFLDTSREGDEGATQTGVLALTPDYAAPEQVRGEPVGTATDTYALGVLLYLLLTDRRPYEVRGRSAVEMERIVCEVEPPRPSTVAPEERRRRIRGDLDLVVMRALHKDAARRYPTASAFADDLRRVRTGLPVTARADDVAYRARKFVARHRVGVAATLVTATALIVATIFSLGQAREAQRQRDIALREVQRQEAMGEMQDVMTSDARDAEGRLLTPALRIALAEEVLVQRFGSQPWLVIEGLHKLAVRLFEIGERERYFAILARAQSMARSASLPALLAETDCRRAWGFVYDELLDSARTALTAARATMQRAGGTNDAVMVRCLDAEGQLLAAEGKGDSAVTVLRRAVGLLDGDGSGTRDQNRDQVLNDLAGALRASGRTREAVTYQRLIVAHLDSVGYRATDLLPNALSFLTSSLFELGELAAVDSLMQGVVAARARMPGGQPGAMVQFLAGLAKLRLGALDAAEPLLLAAMRDTTEGAGGLSTYLPPAITQLYLEQGRLAEARASLAALPTGTVTRRANGAWLSARVRYAEGDVRGGAAMLEDSLRALSAGQARLPAAVSLLGITAGEWRLARGDARGADSLGRHAIAIAAVDSRALARSAYVGRGELMVARALVALGRHEEGRLAAARALMALGNGYGAEHPYTLAAAALRDSLLAVAER